MSLILFLSFFFTSFIQAIPTTHHYKWETRGKAAGEFAVDCVLSEVGGQLMSSALRAHRAAQFTEALRGGKIHRKGYLRSYKRQQIRRKWHNSGNAKNIYKAKKMKREKRMGKGPKAILHLKEKEGDNVYLCI